MKHLLWLTLWLTGAGAVLGCCTVRKVGQWVAIADQEVLITWNAKTHREHFIRTARFDGEVGADFGFLVPTPTQPKLAEVSQDLFRSLPAALQPAYRNRNSYYPDLTPLVLMPFMPDFRGARGKTVAPAVRVLETAHVAGFDAVVLEADAAAPLAEWLKSHQFEVRPAVTEWIKPYIERHWKVTAFRFTGGKGEKVGTKAIDLAFTTDEPIFPYRVPTDLLAPAGKGSLLRVYYVGDEPVDGFLGKDRTPWAAGTRRYARPLERTRGISRSFLEYFELPKADLPENGWLCMFEDNTWPGGTEDLHFRPGKPEEVYPTVDAYLPVGIPVPADLLLLGVVLWRRRRQE
jgi:hypothetical protein